MARKVIAWLLICVMASALFLTAYASEASLFADEVFASATANLKSSKFTIFTCVLIGYADEIKITSCELQKKVNGGWIAITPLPAPDTVAYDTDVLATDMDYSSEITEAGTYRISFTADADGHSITRYSNERTFSN